MMRYSYEDEDANQNNETNEEQENNEENFETETEEDDDDDEEKIPVNNHPSVSKNKHKQPPRFNPQRGKNPLKTNARPHPPGPQYSKREDEYIINLIEESEGRADLELLSTIAKRCNIRFHNKTKYRTGEGLWWRIKRQKQIKNPIYENVMIYGGAPKPKQQANNLKQNENISNPIKNQQRSTPNAPKQRNQANNQQTSRYEVIIRDKKTGQYERMQVTKYNSIEEIMFAL